MINIIPFSKHSGHYNMDQDRYLFDKFEREQGQPTLSIYGWEKPCISLGYSQDPNIELNQSNCREHGIEIVKRPTGGGIVFHNEYEATYSLICDKDDPRLPAGMIESYITISEIVIKALRKFGVNAEISSSRHNESARLCFSYPATYEITLDGVKIVGSAQKRGKKALLQQGSIFVKNSTLKPADFIRNCVDFNSIYDLCGVEINNKDLAKVLAEEFKRAFE